MKLPTFIESQKKQRNSRKYIHLCFIDHTKVFDYVDHNKLWKILKDMEIPDQLTCLLIKLYAGQEATVRTEDGTMDWFKIEKRVCEGCIVSLCYLTYMQSHCCSVAQSCLCDPVDPRKHAWPPCPSPSPRVYPSSCSCLAISSSDALFSFCHWSFPASGTFPMSHLYTSDDQSTGASASPSVLPVNIQG